MALKCESAFFRSQSEQSSQQLQGEVMEISLEDLLRREFPFDEIVPVPKGVHGGDVTQHVRDGNGETCGIILWESKRTNVALSRSTICTERRCPAFTQ